MGLSEEDYTQTHTTLMLMAQLVSTLPLQQVLSAINHAETVGPITDPTLFIQGIDNLRAYERLVERLIPFQDEARRQIEREVARKGLRVTK